MSGIHTAQTCEVFIGYAGEDEEKVDDRARSLSKYDTWVDSKNIILFENDVGMTENRIKEAMDSSKVIIFIVTEAWIGKPFPMRSCSGQCMPTISGKCCLFYGTLNLQELLNSPMHAAKAYRQTFGEY